MERGEFLKVLLDTTALIHILKGHADAITKVDELKGRAILYTTSINIYEVLRGIKVLPKDREKHIDALAILINSINILNFDIEASEAASTIYADLRRKGIVIDPPDYLIAGICLSNSINSIVTGNEKHFGKISGLTVIKY